MEKDTKETNKDSDINNEDKLKKEIGLSEDHYEKTKKYINRKY
jgi:hypothetical protein